jgi:hypothetical protein
MSRRAQSPRVKASRPGAGISKDPGLNPDQLKLLMTGSELQRSITHSWDGPLDMAPGDTKELNKLWERKEYEAKRSDYSDEHGAGLYDSLKSRGYEGKPLLLNDYDVFTDAGVHVPARGIMDGHHRIAAAAALEREGKQVYIPIVHQDLRVGDDDWDLPITPSMLESE